MSDEPKTPRTRGLDPETDTLVEHRRSKTHGAESKTTRNRKARRKARQKGHSDE